MTVLRKGAAGSWLPPRPITAASSSGCSAPRSQKRTGQPPEVADQRGAVGALGQHEQACDGADGRGPWWSISVNSILPTTSCAASWATPDLATGADALCLRRQSGACRSPTCTPMSVPSTFVFTPAASSADPRHLRRELLLAHREDGRAAEQRPGVLRRTIKAQHLGLELAGEKDGVNLCEADVSCFTSAGHRANGRSRAAANAGARPRPAPRRGSGQ